MKSILALATVAALTVGSMASAATLSISGGVFDTIPEGSTGIQGATPKNNVLDVLTGVDNSTMSGFIGSQIVLNYDARLRVEVMGWETGSSQHNTFTLAGFAPVGRDVGEGSKVFADPDPIETFFTGLLTAGALDFTFASADAAGNSRGSVSNDTNVTDGKNFFASFGTPNDVKTAATEKTSGNVLWLFYDDGGVAGDNHDDLVIRISAVPLPAGMLLLMTGVGAIALRRRKKAA